MSSEGCEAEKALKRGLKLEEITVDARGLWRSCGEEWKRRWEGDERESVVVFGVERETASDRSLVHHRCIASEVFADRRLVRVW